MRKGDHAGGIKEGKEGGGGGVRGVVCDVGMYGHAIAGGNLQRVEVASGYTFFWSVASYM